MAPGGSDGRLVLKPVGCVHERDFRGEVCPAWSAGDVRVSEPVATDGGAWSVDRR